jgi:trigger factor
LKTSYEKKSNTDSQLSINIVPSDYEQDFVAQVRQYAKKINVKGFRSNSSAKEIVIAQQHGAAILEEIVLNKGLQAAHDYIKKEDIITLGAIKEDVAALEKIIWKKGETFALSYTLQVVPPFSLSLDGNTAVHYIIGKPSERQVNRAIDGFRCSYGTRENTLAKSLTKDSLVYGSVAKKKQGGKESEKREVFIHVTPSLLDTIEGKNKKPGDTLTIPVDILKKSEFDCHYLFWSASKDITFTIERILPIKKTPLDQAFFDAFFVPGTVTSEQELKEKVAEEMHMRSKEAGEDFLKEELRDLLLKETEITLPKKYEGEKKKISWDLIVSQLAKKNDVKVEQEELVQEIIQVYSRYIQNTDHFNGNLSSILSPLVKKSLEDPNDPVFQEASHRLVEKKALEIIKEHTTITEKKIDSEKFAIMTTRRDTN